MYSIPTDKFIYFQPVSREITKCMKSKNRCRRKTLTLLHRCILPSVSIVKLSWLVSMPHRKMAPRLYDSGGHKPLNPAAAEYRMCPAIPSARDQK